jgi:predicted nuclease of predicted toxin-antitoxin system
MKLLIDNQLPAALAAHLRGKGHDAVHVLDVALDDGSDTEVWTRCTAEGRVLVSKDEDFLILSARPGDQGRLIWVRLGNCRNPALLAAFDAIHDELVAAIDAGRRVVEVR